MKAVVLLSAIGLLIGTSPVMAGNVYVPAASCAPMPNSLCYRAQKVGAPRTGNENPVPLQVVRCPQSVTEGANLEFYCDFLPLPAWVSDDMQVQGAAVVWAVDSSSSGTVGWRLLAVDPVGDTFEDDPHMILSSLNFSGTQDTPFSGIFWFSRLTLDGTPGDIGFGCVGSPPSCRGRYTRTLWERCLSCVTENGLDAPADFVFGVIELSE